MGSKSKWFNVRKVRFMSEHDNYDEDEFTNAEIEDEEYGTEDHDDITETTDTDEEFSEEHDADTSDEIDHFEEVLPNDQDKVITSPALAANLQLKLSAEAGSILISLERLLNLQAGDVLDLANLPPQVNLVLNGLVIGSGLLVEVNGRIGVQISHLNNNAHVV